MHLYLTKFLHENEHFKARSKTIIHQNAPKSPKGQDRWLYPDIVGVYFDNTNNHTNYHKNMQNFINKLFAKIKPIIFSFELKKELVVRNLRESYFQAVSNSSWANEGYLVALEVDESNGDLMDLIMKLSRSFGIGVISLNSQDVRQSKILAKSKFKENIDFNIANELCKNKTFSEFFKSVNEFDIENPERFNDEFNEIRSSYTFDDYIKSNLT